VTEPSRIRPPAQVQPYVQVLGVDGAVEFLLTFGGAELYLSSKPSRSRLVALVGREKAAALAKASEALPRRVPLAKPYLAAVLRHEKGLSVADVARKLHASDTAVRRWLAARPAGPANDPDQPELPF
jgi:DNA-binding transcriptional regulator YiaG